MKLMNKICKYQSPRSLKILMDNRSMDKGEDVMNIIKNYGHHLLFIPPYSSQLNPIEEIFSKWKNLIEARNANTTDELKRAFHNFAENTENDFEDYFNHVRELVLKGVRREEK